MFLIKKNHPTTCGKYSSFKKLKIISEETSLNNTFTNFALKFFSLISIRSEQESKICVNLTSVLKHTLEKKRFRPDIGYNP